MERTGSPELLPVFRSQQQAELLSWVLDHPDEEISISELALRLSIPLTSAHREVERAEKAGLVRSRRHGNLRLVRANTTSPYFDPLRLVLTRAFGPPEAIATALQSLRGIESAYLFGSWAARWHGTPGTREVGDLDVLVLGEPEMSEVYAAVADLEPRLGRAVQVTVRPADWLTKGTGSLHETIAGRPVVRLEVGGYRASAASTDSTAAAAV